MRDRGRQVVNRRNSDHNPLALRQFQPLSHKLNLMTHLVHVRSPGTRVRVSRRALLN